MNMLQKILLVALIITLIVLIIVFWGSMISIIFTLGLISIGPVYLFNRFINNDNTSDFIDDENP
jgi:hypothetical protein